MKIKFLSVLFCYVFSCCIPDIVYASDYAEYTAEKSHAIAMHGLPKYAADFTHFDYVNPDAPKGGKITLFATGSFDTLNPFTLKGMAAAGSSMPFDTLMTSSADEPFTRYPLIAESLEVPQNRSFARFHLNKKAKFHDGSPVTAKDVLFSFNILRNKGNPLYRYYYANVKEARAENDYSVLFIFDENQDNRELPLILSELPILSEKYWQDKDFSATTLSAPLGSGPYRIASFDAGRSITLKRVKDYWAKDLPSVKGLYNFDIIKYDYYRDTTVALEGFKSGAFDLRVENEAKKWAKGYDFPAVNSGMVIKKSFHHSNPSGMQGFVFNLRNQFFQDIKVRKAFTLIFDFEWSNKNLFYGMYHRTHSYFDNSSLASYGLPAGKELALLEKVKDIVPPQVFTEPFTLPLNNGDGQIRKNLESAYKLLQEAGWIYADGALRNKEGKPFTFTILLISSGAAAWERITLPFVRNLARLGIKANVRTVDTAQYQAMMNAFDFDMVVNVWGQSLSPGNEQRSYWGSSSAEQKGSMNYAGIKNPAIDAMIEEVISANSREDLTAAVRALDRLLLHGYYVIPNWHTKETRIAYWDKFGMPDTIPLQGVQLMSWWIDKDKQAKINNYLSRNKDAGNSANNISNKDTAK